MGVICLEDVFKDFENGLTPQFSYTATCFLKGLEAKLSGFPCENDKVDCFYREPSSFRQLAFPVLHVTFPEEALIVDGQRGVDIAKLSGIPCFVYLNSLSNSPLNKIKKNTDSDSRIVIAILCAKETQPTIMNARLSQLQRQNLVRYDFANKLEEFFPGNVATREVGSISIFIISECLHIEVRCKKRLNKNDRKKAEEEFRSLPKSVKREFRNVNEWIEVNDLKKMIENGSCEEYKDCVKMLINFGNNKGPNIRFIMDANLRRCILSAAEVALTKGRANFREEFFKFISQYFKAVQPVVVNKEVKFRLQFQEEFPTILKINGEDTHKCFVILQQIDRKCKFNRAYEEYRRNRGISLIRLTFDFEKNIVHENHNPLYLDF